MARRIVAQRGGSAYLIQGADPKLARVRSAS